MVQVLYPNRIQPRMTFGHSVPAQSKPSLSQRALDTWETVGGILKKIAAEQLGNTEFLIYLNAQGSSRPHPGQTTPVKEGDFDFRLEGEDPKHAITKSTLYALTHLLKQVSNVQVCG